MNSERPSGFFSALMKKWFTPSQKWWLFGLPVGAFIFFIFGILVWGGFNWSLELTNTEEFCISCHEMESTVYQEYKETIHFKNASGVKASCPDCHVPRPWVYKVARKIQATNELYHKMLGTIDTPEKFEAHRQTMANRVWETMRGNDSRECRNCHSNEAMLIAEQSKRAQRKHDFDQIKAEGKTCIDCHQGIAHKLPELAL